MIGVTEQQAAALRAKEEKIRALAEADPDGVLTSLWPHIDEVWLREACRRVHVLHPDTANLDLAVLLERVEDEDYTPENSEVSDAILQEAVAMLLRDVYEPRFLDCSWGFRSGRSQSTLHARLMSALGRRHSSSIVADRIQDFYLAVDHRDLLQFLQRRIGDRVLLKLVREWLACGVVEAGANWMEHQGATPLLPMVLANVYLHHIIDSWFEETVRPTLHGDCEPFRFADEFVFVCRYKSDARRLGRAIAQRVAEYGLRLKRNWKSPLRFSRPARRRGDPHQRPSRFTFLGVRNEWRRSRGGHWVISQTAVHRRPQDQERR